MYSDDDIKIAGDKPSVDVKKNLQPDASSLNSLSPSQISAARKWGEDVAKRFIKDTVESHIGKKEYNSEMLEQRRMLLSFTASAGFEQISEDGSIGGLAQKSFLDALQKDDTSRYSGEDTGAFSFYYLAFRRGNDVERRIGQTFAMLCSHDGDPIYQELGEALYCWFLSVVKNCAAENGII